MGTIPFPLPGDEFEEFKNKTWELFRILFEETPAGATLPSGYDIDDLVTSPYGDILYFLDGGGGVILTGTKHFFPVDFDCTIKSVTLLGDQAGSVVIDIWKTTFALFPPTNADSICGGNEPTITAAQGSYDSTLTGWTTEISSGDVLGINVDSITSFTRLCLALEIKKGS